MKSAVFICLLSFFAVRYTQGVPVLVSFLLDSSSGTGSSDYDAIKSWVRTSTETLFEEFGPDLLVSSLGYSVTGEDISDDYLFDLGAEFTECDDSCDLSVIDGMNFRNADDRYTAFGLNRVTEIDITDQVDFYGTGEEMVFLILLTSGPADDAAELQTWRDSAAAEGVITYAVGLGSAVPVDELRTIANGAVNMERVHQLSNVSLLTADFTQQLLNNILWIIEGSPTTAAPTTAATTAAPTTAATTPDTNEYSHTDVPVLVSFLLDSSSGTGSPGYDAIKSWVRTSTETLFEEFRADLLVSSLGYSVTGEDISDDYLFDIGAEFTECDDSCDLSVIDGMNFRNADDRYTAFGLNRVTEIDITDQLDFYGTGEEMVFLILLTSGPADDAAELQTWRDSAAAEGVVTYAIGLGSAVPVDELRTIANGAINMERVHQLSNVSQLTTDFTQQLLNNMLWVLNGSPTAATPTTAATTTVATTAIPATTLVTATPTTAAVTTQQVTTNNHVTETETETPTTAAVVTTQKVTTHNHVTETETETPTTAAVVTTQPVTTHDHVTETETETPTTAAVVTTQKVTTHNHVTETETETPTTAAVVTTQKVTTHNHVTDTETETPTTIRVVTTQKVTTRNHVTEMTTKLTAVDETTTNKPGPQLDIMIVVDGSSNTGAEDFKKVLKWNVDIVSILFRKFGDGLQTGILVYGPGNESSDTIFKYPTKLGQCRTSSCVNESLSDVSTFSSSERFTAQALRQTTMEDLHDSANKEHSVKFVISVTTGPADDSSDLMPWYQHNTTQDVFAFAIGIGNDTVADELRMVANGNSSNERVYVVKHISRLRPIANTVSDEIIAIVNKIQKENGNPTCANDVKKSTTELPTTTPTPTEPSTPEPPTPEPTACKAMILGKNWKLQLAFLAVLSLFLRG